MTDRLGLNLRLESDEVLENLDISSDYSKISRLGVSNVFNLTRKSLRDKNI